MPVASRIHRRLRRAVLPALGAHRVAEAFRVLPARTAGAAVFRGGRHSGAAWDPAAPSYTPPLGRPTADAGVSQHHNGQCALRASSACGEERRQGASRFGLSLLPCRSPVGHYSSRRSPLPAESRIPEQGHPVRGPALCHSLPFWVTLAAAAERVAPGDRRPRVLRAQCRLHDAGASRPPRLWGCLRVSCDLLTAVAVAA